MNKTLLIAALALSLPTAAFAATYDYVNTSGQVQKIDASSPDQAMVLATNIDPHSGVMLDTGFVTPVPVVIVTTTGMHMYRYVDTNGNLGTVQASSPEQAMMIAPNISPNSGVMQI
jgi:hypothetical protein